MQRQPVLYIQKFPVHSKVTYVCPYRDTIKLWHVIRGLKICWQCRVYQYKNEVSSIEIDAELLIYRLAKSINVTITAI